MSKILHCRRKCPHKNISRRRTGGICFTSHRNRFCSAECGTHFLNSVPGTLLPFPALCQTDRYLTPADCSERFCCSDLSPRVPQLSAPSLTRTDRTSRRDDPRSPDFPDRRTSLPFCESFRGAFPDSPASGKVSDDCC